MFSQTITAVRSGHWPSLLGAWLHFQISCMVWVMIGALAVAISEELALSPLQKGFLVGIPLLGGALLRIVIGPLADRSGPKRTGVFLLAMELIALGLGWLTSESYGAVLGIGLLLGFAGASFAIALPIASRSYPMANQGLAMGIAAVGNSGVLFSAYFAPRIALVVGWRATFGLMMIPVGLTLLLFCLLVRPDSHRLGQPIDRIVPGSVLKHKFLYWLCGMYGVTFGGFVGLSSFLPMFFHDQYRVDLVTAGTLTAVCGLVGSFARPVGGYLADRCGGMVLLHILFPSIAILGIVLSHLPNISLAFPVTVLILLCLGFGNGVVFQIASLRFRDIMGTATGLIGAAGGLGGFILPVWFGFLKEMTGSYAGGFFLLASMAGLAGASAVLAQRRLAYLRGRVLLND